MCFFFHTSISGHAGLPCRRAERASFADNSCDVIAPYPSCLSAANSGRRFPRRDFWSNFTRSCDHTTRSVLRFYVKKKKQSSLYLYIISVDSWTTFFSSFSLLLGVSFHTSAAGACPVTMD